MKNLPSFAELVERHQSMVYSIGWHALRNRARAEDLAQDVFLSLHQHLDTLENEEHVRHWLRRTAANRAIDEIRRGKFRNGPSLVDVREPSIEQPHTDPLLLEQMKSEIAKLPAEARLLTILRYQEDMAPQEIAAQLDIPVNTVKSRLHRTLKLLRGRLTQRQEVRTRS